MSRRRIKTLDYDDEFDDLEDEEDESYDYSEDPRMRESLAEARDVLGSEFTDREIQDSLWYTYYDVEKTINFLLSKKSNASSKTSEPTPKHRTKQALRNVRENWPVDVSSKALTVRDFFTECPWLNVPRRRQALITAEPLNPRGRLLGGSSRDGPKTSKLAALAAARKKKVTEAAATESKPASSNAALLDKLGKGNFQGPRESRFRSEETDSTTQRDRRLRKYPTRQETPVSLPTEIGECPPLKTIPSPAEEEIQYRIASPSTFAATMLGPDRRLGGSWALATSYDAFNLTCEISEANTNPFAGPSPDDVVANAQSASKGLSSKVQQSKSVDTKSKRVESLANGISKTSIDETAQVPPRSKNINVLEEHSRSQKKDAVNFVVIGHVDAGKSTLMGRLLWDLKVVDQRTIEKYRKEAERIGKSSFALAWVLDQNADEREHGVTIDVAMNKFETEKTAFTILDAPGHRDFVPNMIAGASQADFALLVLDASTGNFESGLKGQTKEHTLLVRSMGVQRLIVAVNKLDMVSWSKDRYDEITQQTSAFLAAAGFLQNNLTFVPCSGLNGDNIVNKSTSCNWYAGPTVLALLETSEAVAQKERLSGPFRLPISQVFNAGVQHPFSVAGRIHSGNVQAGDKVTIVPSGQTGYVKALAVDDAQADWAVAGQNATLHLSSDVEAAHIKSGDVVCAANALLQVRRTLTLKVLVFKHLTPMYCSMVVGRLDAPVKLTRLLAVLDKSTGKAAEGKGNKKPRIVKPGEAARIEVTSEAEGGLPIEEGQRVVLRADGETIATGLVERH